MKKNKVFKIRKKNDKYIFLLFDYIKKGSERNILYLYLIKR